MHRLALSSRLQPAPSSSRTPRAARSKVVATATPRASAPGSKAFGIPRSFQPLTWTHSQQQKQQQQQLQQQPSSSNAQQLPSTSAGSEPSVEQQLFNLIALSTAVAFICSVDRAAMSVTLLPMSEQFGWEDSVKGAVSGAFFAGYMVTNLCGGFLSTRYSSKAVLGLGVVVWSLFTMATPAAAASGTLSDLLLTRGMMGLGEGVTYPAIHNLVRRWVPAHRRSQALGLISSGHQMGTIASYLLAPLLISWLDWPAVFAIFGSLGFFWLTGWVPLVRNEPPASPAPTSMAPPLNGSSVGAGTSTSSSSIVAGLRNNIVPMAYSCEATPAAPMGARWTNGNLYQSHILSQRGAAQRHIAAARTAALQRPSSPLPPIVDAAVDHVAHSLNLPATPGKALLEDIAAAATSAGSAASAAMRSLGDVFAASRSTQSSALKLSDVPFREFAANRAVWAIMSAQITVMIGNCLAFSWLPTYYSQQYGVNVEGSAMLTVIPFAATILSTNASGWAADQLIASGLLSRTTTRKAMQAVGSLGPAACLFWLAQACQDGSDAQHAATIITAWLALAGFSSSGHASNHQDVSSKYAGILYGLANGAASVAGAGSTLLTGMLLEGTHSWPVVFELTAGVYGIGALLYLKWASGEKQFE